MGSPDFMQAMGSVALCSALGGAVLTDWRAHRIPNTICLALLGAGLLLRTLEGGLHGTADAALGAGLGLVLFLPLWLLRAMGAGDVKLMAACGAMLGLQLAWTAILATALSGGIYAVAYLALSVARQAGARAALALALSAPRQALALCNSRFPYAVAIATGTLYAWWFA